MADSRLEIGHRDSAARARIARRLLRWYSARARRLPWRIPPGAGARPDPYAVWLSEIMLQQTTVAAVVPYYEAFLARWPTVRALAAAQRDDVLTAWAGLGYYSRARNLHACAQRVTEEFGGNFPDSEENLRTLPGIGPYTAAAIAAIAFGRRTAAVDGNVQRVMARLHAVETPLPQARPLLTELARGLVPARRAGDFAQALMDLGATVCMPRAPHCLVCPLTKDCEARAAGIAADLPRRAPKPAKPVRHGVAFWLRRSDGAVLLRRRPEKGLLGGMMELPGTEWTADAPQAERIRAAAPAHVRWRALDGEVRHTFTHFHLRLVVWAATAGTAKAEGVWAHPDAFPSHALPTVMKKAAAHALRSEDRNK